MFAERFGSSRLIVRIDAAIALRWASVISSMFMVSNGMMFGWVGVVADLKGVDEIGREKDKHDGNGDDEQHSSKLTPIERTKVVLSRSRLNT